MNRFAIHSRIRKLKKVGFENIILKISNNCNFVTLSSLEDEEVVTRVI